MQGTDQSQSVYDLVGNLRKAAKRENIMGKPRAYHVNSVADEAERYVNEIHAAEGNADKIREINQSYGVQGGDVAKYFKDKAHESPDLTDYAYGYKMPQYLVGGAIAWGAVSSVFSNNGRRSNSELYSNPF